MRRKTKISKSSIHQNQANMSTSKTINLNEIKGLFGKPKGIPYKYSVDIGRYRQ